MIDHLPTGAVHVKNARLWAHVGVLEHERLTGQWFSLDFSLWLNLDLAAVKDDLSLSVDYSVAIRELQQLSSELNCLTIEYFSEQILDHLEALFGAIPMKVLLRKCNAPVPGFDGSVEIERLRNWPVD